MANEFKIKKGLIVTGADGGTVVDIQGSQGQLFSVTDDLSGSIFAVSDISGVPILDVNSSGTVTIDGLLTGDDATFSKRLTLNSPDYAQHLTMRRGIYGYDTIITGTRVDFSPTADTLSFKFLANLQTTGDVSVSGGDLNVGSSTTVNSVINMLGTNDSFIEKDTGNHLYFANNVGDKDIKFRIKDDTTNVIALTIDGSEGGDATFVAQAFSAATSSGDSSSTLTTKGYVDGLITGATIYRGAWQAGISATSSAATTASTTLTVTAAILDADGNTPVLVGAVVTGEGITGIVKVASVTSSTVYVLDTAITATATAYIFSPIYGAPDLSGVTETSGYYYICSEAGSATPNGANSEPNTWAVGDWCIYNDVSGTGQWQKIDNSSVLSGAGTGQTVALWEGPSSVTDSETLGNAPITVSGDNTTFEGNVLLNDGTLTVGADAAGRDVMFRGGTSGAYFMYDASEDGVVIVAPTDEVALGIRVVGGGQATVPQFTVGRDIGQYLGIKVDDRISSVIHRQDETTGVMQMNQEIWDNGTGIHKWNWISADGAGASASTKMTLNKTGELNVSTSVTSTTFLGDHLGTINTATTGVTQTAGDDSTKIATTAYADAAAAAVPIGNYLPLAGGTMTGVTQFNDHTQHGDQVSAKWGAGNDLTIQHNATNSAIANSVGNLYISNHADDKDIIFECDNGSGASVSYLTLDGSTTHAYFSNPGNVGIGTTSPSTKLEVDGITTSLGFRTDTTSTNWSLISRDSAGNSPLYVQSANSGTGQPIAKFNYGSATANGGNNVLTVAKDSSYFLNTNVGIGTTNPSRKMEVVSDSGIVTVLTSTTGGSYISMEDSATTSDSQVRFGAIGDSAIIKSGGTTALALNASQNATFTGNITFGDSHFIGDDGDDNLLIQSSANENIIINSVDDLFLRTGGTTKLIVKNGGNVGIGTTSPAAKLHVDDSVGGKLRLSNISATADGEKIGGIETGVANGTFFAGVNFFRHDANDGEIRFRTKVNNTNTDVMAIVDGNVGIGTTSPGAKLELYEVSGGAPTLLTLHQNAVDIVADDSMGSFIDFKSTDINPNFTPQARIGMLIRDSGGDSGVDSEGCGNLVFHTSRGTNSTGGGVDVERMRITDIGNVGIGTTTPNAKLDVQGTQGQLFSVTDDLSGDIFSVADISGVPIMNVNSDGTSYFDGNVGIGTTSPGYTLDVNGSMHSTNITIADGIYHEGDSNNYISFGTDIQAFTTSGSERMRINSAGNVGIGTTSPTSGIHVNTSQSAARFISSQGAGLEVQGGGNSQPIASFKDTAASEKVRISSTGDVGIGTNSPGDKLHVNGTVRSQAPTTSDWGLIGFNSAGTASSGLWFESGSGDILLRRSDNSLQTRIRSAGNSYINGGNLGLNTTGPAERLTINSGRMLVTNSTTPIYIKVNSGYKSWVHHISSDDGYIFAPSTVDGGETWDWANQTKLGANGVVRAKNFELSSDERFKDNVKDIKDNEIKVAFKSFEIKSSPGEKRYGVIAQELEKNNPELVTTDTEGFKSVKYIDLLIAKIAELEARLEKLEK